MEKIVIIMSIIFVTTLSFADSLIQKVGIEPLYGGVSFNTVNLHANDVNWGSWVTAPSVEMIGRKQILIKNISPNTIVYLTGVSGSSVKGTLQHKEWASFNASSSLHIYVSANTVNQVECWEIR